MKVVRLRDRIYQLARGWLVIRLQNGGCRRRFECCSLNECGSAAS